MGRVRPRTYSEVKLKKVIINNNKICIWVLVNAQLVVGFLFSGPMT